MCGVFTCFLHSFVRSIFLIGFNYCILAATSRINLGQLAHNVNLMIDVHPIQLHVVLVILDLLRLNFLPRECVRIEIALRIQSLNLEVMNRRVHQQINANDFVELTDAQSFDRV